MGFPTKVQRINRKKSEQWYINFPSAVAQSMEFAKGETVEWFIEDKETLVLHRPEAPDRRLKKTPKHPSSARSSDSSDRVPKPSAKNETDNGAPDSS